LGKQFDAITPDLADWIGRQHVFFVASAPLAGDGHVNCSPKGLDTLRVLGPRQVAYLDLTGSGAETIAHLRENGRIVFLFCALSGSPRLLRLHGTARVVTPEASAWEALHAKFPALPGARAIIVADISRIADSCGFGVPLYDFAGERDTLPRWAQKKGSEGVRAYQGERNAVSVDGLPALAAGASQARGGSSP
jgi:hypothetical protein